MPASIASSLPSGRTVLLMAIAAFVGAGATFGGLFLTYYVKTRKPAPIPPPYDARFAVMGKAYIPELAAAYAAAWDEGVKALEAGQSVSAAVETVAKAWTTNRTALYDKTLTPAFSKIVAQSVKDSDVTSAERAALIQAWRGLSIGLKE